MAYRNDKGYPRAGGWLEQPLAFLVTATALDSTVTAARALYEKNDLSDLSLAELEITAWMQED